MKALTISERTPPQDKKHSQMDLDTCSTLILPRTRSPRVVIQEKSLQPLMKANLLNDEVINGALRLLEAAAGDGVYVFDPMAPKQFMQKKMAELPDTKFIIPMNIKGIHWVLGIRRPKEGIQVYDSLPGATKKASIKDRFPDNIDNVPVRISSPLKQSGKIDCGVFTIFTAFYDALGFDLDHFQPLAPRGHGLPQPYDPDPKFWRQKLLVQLLKRRPDAKESDSGSCLVELDELEYPDDESYLLGQITAVTRTRSIINRAIKRAEGIDAERYPEARKDVLARFRDAEEFCKRHELRCHEAIRKINEKRKEEAALKRKRSDTSALELLGCRKKKPLKDSMSPEVEHCRKAEAPLRRRRSNLSVLNLIGLSNSMSPEVEHCGKGGVLDEEQSVQDDKEPRGPDDKTDTMSVMSKSTGFSYSRPLFDALRNVEGAFRQQRCRRRRKKKKATVNIDDNN
ncbi:hypothetical protein V8F33_005416 [Rhypophila sp. PSN 637]